MAEEQKKSLPRRILEAIMRTPSEKPDYPDFDDLRFVRGRLNIPAQIRETSTEHLVGWTWTAEDEDHPEDRSKIDVESSILEQPIDQPREVDLRDWDLCLRTAPHQGSFCMVAPSVARGYLDEVMTRAYGGIYGGYDRRRQLMEAESEERKKALEKSWALLKDYLPLEQYEAFLSGRTIETENKEKTYRLLINMTGYFQMLKGKRGEGITVLQGSISEYNYPMGDAIAAFLDWFNLKTEELITNWGCGSFSIRKSYEAPERRGDFDI